MNGKDSLSVPEILSKAADLYTKRNATYDSAYLRHGKVLAAFFENGVTLKTEDDFIRFGALSAIIGKLTRYCPNFEEGGHTDSAFDAINFCAMLTEIDLKNGGKLDG